jgi:hypothetical protein
MSRERLRWRGASAGGFHALVASGGDLLGFVGDCPECRLPKGRMHC